MHCPVFQWKITIRERRGGMNKKPEYKTQEKKEEICRYRDFSGRPPGNIALIHL